MGKRVGDDMAFEMFLSLWGDIILPVNFHLISPSHVTAGKAVPASVLTGCL